MVDAAPRIEYRHAKSNRGGKRPGAGRKPGQIAKAKMQLRDLAKEHVPAMLQQLVDIARNSESDAARVSAIKEILDRAHGKAPQAIVGDDENPIVMVTRVELVAAGLDDSED